MYSPGNVELRPEILKNRQEYIAAKLGQPAGSKPVYFVFHGGSGSPKHQIAETLNYGAIKMNIDTDMQWASWKGVLNFYKKNKDFLQKQLGNKNGKNIPNKKYYDPRSWIRESQESMSKRLEKTFKDLNAFNIL